MKTINIFSACVFLLIVLILFLVMTNFDPPAVSAKDVNLVAFQQTTPTPQDSDISEIGSTDGILIMGVVIVLIVTAPLIFQKRK